MAKNVNTNYKAQFCKQYFIDLRDSFIKKFCLSSYNESGNDLGMHFLLDAYDKHDYSKESEENLEKEVRKIQNRKNFCYWEFGKVSSKDLMLAIDEYFWITSQNPKLKRQQATLMDCLLNPEYALGPEKYIHVEDITLYAILLHYGVIRDNGNKMDIGSQIIELKKFLQTATNINEGYERELRYLNALYLFKELRNLQGHELEMYDGQKKIRYHEFILFTYIGLCYLCRKLWNTEESAMRLGAEMYSTTEAYDKFEMAEEEIVVQIDTCNGEAITSCSYSCGNRPPVVPDGSKAKLPSSHIEFKMKIRKYEEVVIRLSCGGRIVEPPITRMFKYSDWNLALLIMLPPVDAKYHCFDVAGKNEEIDTLVDGIVNRIKDEYEGDLQDALMQVLGNFEPLFNKARNEEKENLKYDLIKSMRDLDDSLTYVSNQMEFLERNVPDDDIYEVCREIVSQKINEQNESIEKLYQEHFGIQIELLNVLDEKVDTIIETTRRTEEKIDRLLSEQESERKEELKAKDALAGRIAKRQATIEKVKRFLLFIPLGFALFVFLSFMFADWTLFMPVFSLYKTTVGCLLLAAIIGLVSFLSFLYVEKGLKRIRKWEWAVISMTLLLLVTAICFVPSRIKRYDYMKHNGENNTAAVHFMECYLNSEPNDDEDVRVQLATYYLKFANQPDKAVKLTAPMIKDIERYPKGSIALAEAYYELRNEDNYSLIKRIVERYKERIGDSIPAVVRLEGILTAFGEGGFTRDIQRADSLLKFAADAGDIEAQYLFGHLLSNYTEKWKMASDLKSAVFQIAQYDLYLAIWYLRKASKELPKAAIELGDIYSDLNMNDSASFYYRQAIEPAADILKGEALYKLGLLNGNGKNDEMIDAAYKYDYKPAILHLAKCDSSHSEIIKYYKKYGYQGHYFIHPLAFEYVAIGDLNKAYEVLRDSVPEGKFDMNFVRGMESILADKDDLKAKGLNSNGMDYILKSAENGCLFAEMMCIYMEMQGSNRISTAKLSRLMEIGKVIPFAYLLLSHVDKFFGDNLWSGLSALQASALKHPSVGKVLAMKLSNYVADMTKLLETFIGYDEKGKRFYEGKGTYSTDDLLYLQFERNLHNIELRTSPFKSTSLTVSYRIDQILWHIYSDGESYSLDRLQFWSEIAIANHDYFNECMLLKEYIYYSELKGESLQFNPIDVPNMQKLILAALRHYVRGGGGLLEECNDILSLALFVVNKSAPEFVDSLYSSNRTDKELSKLFTENRNPAFHDIVFNKTMTTWLNPDELLTELSSYFENTLFVSSEALKPVE